MLWIRIMTHNGSERTPLLPVAFSGPIHQRVYSLLYQGHCLRECRTVWCKLEKSPKQQIICLTIGTDSRPEKCMIGYEAYSVTILLNLHSIIMKSWPTTKPKTVHQVRKCSGSRRAVTMHDNEELMSSGHYRVDGTPCMALWVLEL